MAPLRTNDTQPEASSSTSHSKDSKNKQKPQYRRSQPGKESATPGVSKVKSSLRQTRRLLAKVRIKFPGFGQVLLTGATAQDKLAADVRIDTERRLKALEAELVQAELANKERTIAERYHKIKFFGA
jgi:hypothetical protein